MSNLFQRLVNERVAIDSEIAALINRSWNTIQSELGVETSLRAIATRGFDIRDGQLVLDVPVRLVATESKKERVGVCEYLLPVDLFDESGFVSSAAMRRLYPLTCTECGLRFPPGTLRCLSPGHYWGRLAWREDSPPPKYYVEASATHGYYEPGPRRLRYVIDLERRTISGVEVTLRDGTGWHAATNGDRRSIIDRLERSVCTEMENARTGGYTQDASSRCFSLELPSWYDRSSRAVAINFRRPKRLFG